MRKNHWLVVFNVIVFLVAMTNLVSALDLSSSGVTNYVIVKPDSPSQIDDYAVGILSTFLQQKTSITYSVVSSQGVNGHKKICVGLGSATIADLGVDPTASFDDQEFVVKNVGDNIYLYGKGLHGNLYAVVDFLDNTLGRGWCVESDKFAPAAVNSLSISPFNFRKKPSFAYRMLGFPSELNYQQGCNIGFNEETKAAWGLPAGMLPAMDNRAWAHTTFLYIPPTVGRGFEWLQNKGYFSTHPEFYSMNQAGQRVAEQLCFSNAGLRAELTSNIIGHILRVKQENTGLPILISLGQEDASTGKFCHCPACVALDATYTSNAGAFFDYLRSLSSTLQAQHPDVMVKILAYRRSQTQIPPVMPAGVQFPSNVIVEFCGVEDVLNKTWEDTENSYTYRDIAGWTSLSPHVWVRSYYLYGAALLMPFNCMDRLATEMQMMKTSGAEGAIFELYPEGGFTDVLQYLYLKLAQDVDSSVDTLLATFCETEYGPAAQLARNYLEEVETASKTGAKNMGIIHSNIDFNGAFSYLTNERIRNWQASFDAMNVLVGNDTRLKNNIKLLRRSLDFATIGKWCLLAAAYPGYFTDYTVVTGRIGEVNSIRKPVLDDWVLKIQAGGVYNPLPASFSGFPKESISEFVPLNNSNDAVKNILDSSAAFGYAATVNSPGVPFNLGFCQNDIGHYGPDLSITQGNITPDAWTIYHLGGITLTPACLIWLGGSGMTNLDLGPSFRPSSGNLYDAYVSLKFKGVAYGGQGESMVLCDRIILIDKSTMLKLTTGNAFGDWNSDQAYVTQTVGWGNLSSIDIWGYAPTITGTTEQQLYSVERFGNFSYAIPVNNGQYTVKLHFVELYHAIAGNRIFNVNIEGASVLANFDIIAQAGERFAAIQRTFDVTVADGALNLDFIPVIDNAKIAAIEITRKADSIKLTTGNAFGDWERDQAYVTQTVGWGGNSSIDICGYAPIIAGTTEQQLYSVERFGNFNYAIPVNNGQYTVKLHFVELRHAAAGNRIFNVDIEAASVLTNFDIIVQAGARFAAIQRSFDVTVADGVLNLGFVPVIDNAKVAAIEITPTANAIKKLTTGNAFGDWERDQAYVTQTVGWGNLSSIDICGYAPTITDTTEQQLYSIERFGNFSYAIPVNNGQYTVKLHFVELYHAIAGNRIFNVNIEGASVLANFDIIAQAGERFAAIQRTFDVTVADGVLNLDFVPVIDNAKITAIEITPK